VPGESQSTTRDGNRGETSGIVLGNVVLPDVSDLAQSTAFVETSGNIESQ
jgi:hypothetical protein